MRRLSIIFALLALVLSSCAGAPPEVVTLKIGVLPILDALPMYVADSQGMFTEQGIRVITGAPNQEPVALVQNYLAGSLATGPNVCDH